MKLSPGVVRAKSKCTHLIGRQFHRDNSTSRSLVRRIGSDFSIAPLIRSSLQRRDNKPQAKENEYLATFQQLVESRFNFMVRAMGKWTLENEEWRMFGIHSQHEVNKETRLFIASIQNAFVLASWKGLVGRSDNPLFWKLRNGFVRGDAAGLTKELRFAFYTFSLKSRFSKAVTASHQRMADFRYPFEWFPATRAMQRTIHLHVGPTNSGKTYRALKALEAAESGIYAGPLRLLAHEIFSRFQAKGMPCCLITGEEQRYPDGEAAHPFQSCTVEMTPLNKRVDVAVIDEIQMIADEERGWAWTQAFLGVQAREVHLCGEERTVELIQALCAKIGDKCIVNRYKRLSSLQAMNESLRRDFTMLRKGDAVVSFSRLALHTLKAGIEKHTGRRCAIVYGSLPPETRAQQAALFNDPDNDYDFLVASDAIGMGLNLEIKRVIFENVMKHDGMSYRTLSTPELKQIGGRAGRYRTAAQDIKGSTSGSEATSLPGKKWGTPGFVTTLESEDLIIVQDAFNTEAEQIRSAGIQPPVFVVEKFSTYFPPNTPLSFILLRLRDLARLSGQFHMCSIETALEIADIIQPFPMSIGDRCIMLSAPVALRDHGQRQVVAAFAKCISDMARGHILDFREIDLEILDRTKDDFAPGEYLRRLEALHKSVTLYLWLTYRYVGVFTSQSLAFHIKGLVEEKITDFLDHVTFVPEKLQKRSDKIRKLMQKRHEREETMRNVGGGDNLPTHEGVGRWTEEGHQEPLLETPEEADMSDTRAQRKSRANSRHTEDRESGSGVDESRV